MCAQEATLRCVQEDLCRKDRKKAIHGIRKELQPRSEKKLWW